MLLAMLTLAACATVQAACDQPVGTFVSLTGVVDVQPSGSGDWDAASLDSRLCEGDTIRVGERSRAAVSLINDAVLRIDQNTAMRLIDITPQEQETSLLDMFSGAFQSFSRKPKFLKVNTPYLNGSVEGTEFAIRVDDDSATITVLEGRVVASNDQGEVAVQPGEAAQARKGQAPTREIVVNPRDQVQWALYYPPILSATAVADGSPSLSKAANCAANGNTACAFDALDGVPAAQRDANYLLLRASVLLAVGRVDEARADIDGAVARDDQASAAHALRAVIGVAQNQNEAALADGRRAVELDPDSAVAKIALSYALQANLELVAARKVLQQAVEQSPDNALAWARLAELQLAEGRRREATASAERAVQLQPGLSRTQNVLGFSALAEIKTAQAQAAFEQAIALDSADPLPRLGLGLAKIRRGQLEEGRGDIEAAVALDSNNALLRAYLGKAYFEEKRGPLDDQQFRIAKELDPLDPTAYFYNAIRLQTENRPVEALRELEASIERNDNRAVYRSRLLLDQDRAARGTSLARVYSNLGFEQLGLGEARRSLTLSPANASAHRFLSDSYQHVRRREISRVSELLQAQLLQDVNINPVQPSVSETNLNAMGSGGPSNIGFNEFTPLFERNAASANLSGFVGSNDTLGGEVVASGVYDQVSLSAGAYHYETDGWRPNNQLDQDIFNIFAQVAVTPELNVQLEFRHRESKEGDLAFNFDPEDFLEDKTVEREQDTARVGLRYSPSASTSLLFSYIHNDRDERLTQSEALEFPYVAADLDVKRNDKGHQIETQYILEQPRFNLIAGLGYNDIDVREERSAYISHLLHLLPPPPGVPPFLWPPANPIDASSPATESGIEHKRIYLYSNVDITDAVTATLGGAYDDYDEDTLQESGFYPKAGIQWQPNERLRVRGAAFKTLKPPVVNNRTIEPTQIAGFNQFFDDINATESTLYGAGFDLRMNDALTVGAELTWRDLNEPVFVEGGGTHFEDRDEERHRAFLYWTPAASWAVSAAVEFDRYEANLSAATADGNVPEEVETFTLPVSVRYFSPTGLFAGLGATYVDQEVRRAPTSTQAGGSDSFFLVDASIGYRLPKRRGAISLEVKNLFDEDFRYQDDSYREFRDEPATGPYFPERTIMGQLTLNF